MYISVVSRKFIHTKDWVLFSNSQMVEGEREKSSEFRERKEGGQRPRARIRN